MNKSTDPLSWIEFNDHAQTKWVEEYLKRQLPPCYLYTNTHNVIEIRTYNDRPLYGADLTILINKMRAAWRQKVFRSKQNGKKTYSFVMSRGIEAKLKALSGKGEIRKTLEDLIENVYKFEAPKIDELHKTSLDLKFKISKLHEDNRILRETNKKLTLKIKRKDNEIATLQEEVKSLQQGKINLANELKQLKEKHNNQFRKEDTDTKQ
ncbi:MAG: hypothetical protein IPP76_11080 [Moraxellaceae bacterium]|nr:hypothetical protein [Moraxellaceae bacterium]